MRYYRRVIRITAADSPNVRFALAQQRKGLAPTGEQLVPGVLSWDEYRKRRALWDPVRQCVGLDAEFWEGAELLLFPPDWLNHSEARARELGAGTVSVGGSRRRREAKAIGIDPAEGGDKTAMCAVDDHGILELVSRRTPDTSVVVGECIAFIRKWNVPHDRVVFDRGGGGKQHADRLRQQGYKVRTVAFGESVMLDPKRGLRQIEERMEDREERYAYKNRRAQMYCELSLLCDPKGERGGFGIPAEYRDLRSELSIIPRSTDDEGRLFLPPKPELIEIIGHSPDEADALVLAVHGMLHKAKRATVTAF